MSSNDDSSTYSESSEGNSYESSSDKESSVQKSKTKMLSNSESNSEKSENTDKSDSDNSQKRPKAKAKKESKTTSKTEKSSESSDPEKSEPNTKSTSNKSNSKEAASSKTQTDLAEEEEEKPFDFTVVPKNVPQNLKTDRFGWAIDEENDTKVTKKDKKLDEIDSKKESERESKWIYMMKKENWRKFYKKNGKYRKVLERRVKKGIPNSLRSKAWHLILDPKSIDENLKRETIDSYFDKEVPSCDYVIRVDIPRTMPRVPMFTKKDVRISLYRILRAYSNKDPELGYYQGMAFSAAILRSYMDETSAFWSFVGLMKGRFHNLRSFYDNQFTRLKEINKVWDYILLKKFKNVRANLIRNNIDHLLYTTSWFLCAFLNVGFDPALRLRIFDRFALFGPRALISFGLTIIDMNKTELATGAFDVVIPILQNPHQSKPMKNWRDVIKVYDKDFITKKDYKNYFKKAGVKL